MDPVGRDQFEALFAAAPLGIVAVATDGRILRANAALDRMFGYAPGQLIGLPVEALLPEAARAAHSGHRATFLASPHTRPMGQGLELEGRRREGRVFPIEVSLTHLAIDGVETAIAFVADVSERARLTQERDQLLEREREARRTAEATERETRETARRHEVALAQLHTFVESAPIGLGFLDAGLRFQLINAHLAALNGLPPAAHIGRTLYELLPRLAERLGPVISAVLRTGQPAIDLEFVAAPGDEIDPGRQYLVSYYPVRGSGGATLGAGVIVQDITERRRAEAAQRLSERRFRAIFDDAPLGMMLVSPAGQILEANPAFQRMLGYDAATIRAGGPPLWVHPEDLPAALRLRGEIAVGEREQASMLGRFVRSDGTAINVSVTASLVEDNASARFLLVVAEDVTERLRAAEAHARLAAIIDSTDDAIIGASFEDEIFAWNAGAERLYGYSAAEVVGRSRLLVVPEDRRDEMRRINAAVARGESVVRVETVCLHKDGRRIDVALTFSPIVDSSGRRIGVSAIARDMGERKRAEEALRKSEQLYRTLARNLPNGAVLLFDQQLRYTVADGSALAAAGLSSEQIEGRTLYEVLLPEAVRRLEPLYLAALRGQPGTLEIEGGEHIYRSHFLPVQDERGAIIAGMAMSYDVTELKRVERELREERELLARRVAERTADLSLANAQLARAARLKDEFLANMSHELRTPLNSILGRSEALQEGIYGPLTARQAESLRGIEESGRHLLSLINDVLDLSKIEAERLELELEPVEIDLLCHASLRMVGQLAMAKRISLSSTLDGAAVTIYADGRRLKQVLVNLLINAVKFTPEGGRVGLEVSADEARQRLTFTVWDSGIGIAREDLARLFQPFTQIDSSLSREYAGTGLGLALVLRLTEAHGGSVAVESAPGEGSRFSVRLPWSPGVQAPGAVYADLLAPAPPAPRLRRVLVVEDSATAASQIERYLEELGAKVERLAEAQGAVERAAALQPDLIILDVLLPDGSGWEVLGALKADPRTQGVPVVVVSVVDEPSRATALGAAAFLLKPLSRATLTEALQQLAGAIPQPRPSAAARAAWPRVLVVEDNQASSAVLQDYLESHGYAVTVARSGFEAIRAAQEEPVDIILMDIQMPGMDGMETIRQLRAAPPERDAPIIAITALAMPGDRERCLEAGANEYLAKPLNLRALLSLIERQLGR